MAVDFRRMGSSPQVIAIMLSQEKQAGAEDGVL
jgi:hypothetical protein